MFHLLIFNYSWANGVKCKHGKPWIGTLESPWKDSNLVIFFDGRDEKMLSLGMRQLLQSTLKLFPPSSICFSAEENAEIMLQPGAPACWRSPNKLTVVRLIPVTGILSRWEKNCLMYLETCSLFWQEGKWADQSVSHVLEVFEDLPSAEMEGNFLQKLSVFHLSEMRGPCLDVRSFARPQPALLG